MFLEVIVAPVQARAVSVLLMYLAQNPVPSSSPAFVSSLATQAADRAVRLLAARQHDGHWPCDYGGPLFLLPGFVIAYHVTGQPQHAGFVHYLRKTQRADGGWGLHTEGESTVLGTTLCYVAMRLLGASADDPAAVRARRRLHALGGAETVPSWGKLWLAVLGVYDWAGVPPVPPELWLLPRRFALHPGHLWCHTRAVLLPMSHLWGARRVARTGALVDALREEVFSTSPDQIDWPSLRDRVAAKDVYAPPGLLARLTQRALRLYERAPSRRLRARALAETALRMRYEDEASASLTIGPVSKALRLVVLYQEEGDSPAFRRHLARVEDYLWADEDGLKVRGYNGSQLWDAAFAAQALLAHRALPDGDPEAGEMALRSAYGFIDRQQVRSDLPEHDRYDRARIAGGWPFSTAEQGWTVSDCTAEALKVALAMQPMVAAPIALPRLELAVARLLEQQNADGGWSEYEPKRGGWLLECLHDGEVFGDSLVARSYLECTSACIQALTAFSRRHPTIEVERIARAIRRGAAFLRAQQRSDGSFYGSWGVCFTYGAWFAVEGLRAAGEPPGSLTLRRTAAFLRGKQRSDGGWGEAFASCPDGRWVEHAESQVVQTAWALMALEGACAADDASASRVIARGVELLIQRQRPDGSWAKESPAGVFNRSCAIDYDNYRYIMPLWALCRCAAYLYAPTAASTPI